MALSYSFAQSTLIGPQSDALKPLGATTEMIASQRQGGNHLTDREARETPPQFAKALASASFFAGEDAGRREQSVNCGCPRLLK